MQFESKAAEEAVNQRIASFAFAKLPESPMVILLQGEEGSGKTHFACTMKELGPVYILDTELRAERVATQLFGIDTIARIFSYEDMYVAVAGIIKHLKPPGTIVLDSATDLTKFAEQQFLEEAKMDKIYPKVLWAKVYEKCNRLYDAIKRSGFNLVLTARMKDEYIGENRSGKKLVKIYEEIPYKADIVVQCFKDKKKELLKRPYGIDMKYPFTLQTTLPSLIRDLRQESPAKELK